MHLEVWKDLDNNEVNEAAEWIYPLGTKDPRKPWAFVVGRDGRISLRFDNVATDAELEQAVVDVTISDAPRKELTRPLTRCRFDVAPRLAVRRVQDRLLDDDLRPVTTGLQGRYESNVTLAIRSRQLQSSA